MLFISIPRAGEPGSSQRDLVKPDFGAFEIERHSFVFDVEVGVSAVEECRSGAVQSIPWVYAEMICFPLRTVGHVELFSG